MLFLTLLYFPYYDFVQNDGIITVLMNGKRKKTVFHSSFLFIKLEE